MNVALPRRDCPAPIYVIACAGFVLMLPLVLVVAIGRTLLFGAEA